MFSIVTRTRALLAAVAIALFAPAAVAKDADPLPAGTARSPQPTKGNDPSEEQQRNGSPELGILIIIGAVAFIILVTWLIARVGDGRSSGDSSLN